MRDFSGSPAVPKRFIFASLSCAFLWTQLTSVASPASANPATNSATSSATNAAPSSAPNPASQNEPDATATGELSSSELDPAAMGKLCREQMLALPHAGRMKNLERVCGAARQLPGCVSVKNEGIFHFDRPGTASATGSKSPDSKSAADKNAPSRAATEAGPAQHILVFGLIHGDELPAGSVAMSWMNRLSEIEPRNSWRVVPMLNPDGWRAKTRTNANGVDVNRNFPSRDWDDLALKYWKEKSASAERRYPGPKASSEPETRCAIAHIEDFKPDFIISIHTPLGTLDFDGPKRLDLPKFSPLPWVSLGNYPGSLGRYMWVDRNVPVLTVELKSNAIAMNQLEQFDKLQDITGTIALQSERALKRKKNESDPVNSKR